jgi:hypothetical protein
MFKITSTKNGVVNAEASYSNLKDAVELFVNELYDADFCKVYNYLTGKRLDNNKMDMIDESDELVDELIERLTEEEEWEIYGGDVLIDSKNNWWIEMTIE